MILILTYHRVLRPAMDATDADFYSVTDEHLMQQITAARARGFVALEPQQLRNAARDWSGKNLVVAFDDGTTDHWEIVLPALKKLDLRGVFFVPTAKLNRPRCITDEHLREIAAAGHVIGCHGHEHKRLDTLPAPEIRHQLETACEILTRLTGSAPWIFAPPGGFLTDRVCIAARDCGLSVIRTMRWGLNLRPDFTALETAPLNRHITDRRFEKILEGKAPRLLYHGKEAAKALVPARAYEAMRRLVFRLARKK